VTISDELKIAMQNMQDEPTVEHFPYDRQSQSRVSMSEMDQNRTVSNTSGWEQMLLQGRDFAKSIMSQRRSKYQYRAYNAVANDDMKESMMSKSNISRADQS